MAYALPHRFTPQYALRHSILSQFACPYQGPSVHCTVPLPLILGRCPFGHEGRPSNHQRLRALPPYICTASLLGRCTGPTHSNSFSDEPLIRCATGFHPDLMDLVDLARYANRIALTLLARDQNGDTSSVEGPSTSTATSSDTSSMNGSEPDDRECSICLEPILGSGRQFGLLEHCSHVFCFPCLATWHHQDTTRRCPVCRTPSRRTMVWPAAPCTQEHKRSLFELQQQCLYLYSMSYQRVAQPREVTITRGQPNQIEGQPNPTTGAPQPTVASLLAQTESLTQSLDRLANTIVNIQQQGRLPNGDGGGPYTDMVTAERGVDHRNLRYL